MYHYHFHPDKFPVIPPFPAYYPPFRQFPSVNEELFMTSAKRADPLIKDAEILLKKISSSHSFSKKWMELAQKSQINEVNKLLEEVKLKTKPTIRYNPSGTVISFANADAEIVLNLRW